MNRTFSTVEELIQEIKEKEIPFLSLGREMSNNLGDEAPKLSDDVPILTKIPQEIFALDHLTVLKIDGQQIKEIDDNIKELKNLRSLDLSDNDITQIPKSVFELTQLERLDLSGNKLVNIPNQIEKLSNLKILNLGDNKFDSFPSAVTNLVGLRSLSLSGHKFNTVPRAISNLQNLQSLDLQENKLVNLPACLFQLYALESLNLGDNNINEIPSAICRLLELKSLMLYRNNLTGLPRTLENLTNLKKLTLWNNKFEEIPDVVYELKKLEEISFGNNSTSMPERNNNQIKKVSSKLLKLKRIKVFELVENPIENPPIEIANKGVDALKNYFRTIIHDKQDYLYEAKLIIVGEGGAGKTTLARKIVDQDYPLIKEEKSTEGIEVTKYNFKSNGKRFSVSIWDFGGQEIYHATHQFFLTKRSLYLLVADTRKEDTDFFYWLNIIKLLTSSSPLLIIKNEKQDRIREINEPLLRSQFENLKETIRANFLTKRGLDDVNQNIKHYISSLPHIGSPLPKTWIRIREELEKRPEDYISLEEYFSICQKNRFFKKEDKLHLIDYLHDLGICLYFGDDPLLKKTVILKPKWGTTAVYKVLDNKGVIENLGRFKRSDLIKIWHEDEYANMQDELLRLMINFKLCYEIPDSESYIAPQLLSENQCEYEWNEEENLILRYEYEFMPKGIITRFIVEMHNHIENQDKVWKTGIILSKGNARAEVIEYYNTRELRVRVSGKSRKELLTITSYILDKINATYRGLKFDKLIPCNCTKCRGSQTPAFYKFDILQQFIEDNQSIQCPKSYELVDGRELKDDISVTIRAKQEIETLTETRIINNFGSISIQQSNMDRFNIETKDIKFDQLQQASNSGNQIINNTKIEKNIMDSNNPVRSAWANGLFYLFTFVVVIACLGFLANSIPWYAVPLTIIAGIMFVPTIGALQLKQDNRVSDKTFVELMKIVFGQLPLISKFFNSKQIETNLD